MNPDIPLVDLAPLARLALLAAVVALLPLSWVWLRRRGSDRRSRLAALTAITLFLTFDLVVFGSFTRLSDSGLGCPDWPGCYGEASPFGAKAEIQAEQAALPSGPVTWKKAWIEMIHRYLAMTVGVLILVMAAVSALERRQLPHSGWWPAFTLVWVLVQGLFGKYTVTLKLYPAIVTLHLLGGLMLLALLAFQHAAFQQRPLALAVPLRRLAVLAFAVLMVQIALGGWVSTNYAVLACTGFPACNGQWWPAMDFAHGFTPLRHLGVAADGSALPFEALVAIHMAHRLFAVVATAVLGWLAWRLWTNTETRRWGALLAALLLAQLISGLSNVVLGWPLVAALGHSAGAAALVLCLSLLLARSRAAVTVTAPPASAPVWVRQA
ncbi:MAG: COX15/CtaA family protein [Rubrivivax sp.]|jgi:cytochrome c oxidase assembly protein subunit 15